MGRFGRKIWLESETQRLSQGFESLDLIGGDRGRDRDGLLGRLGADLQRLVDQLRVGHLAVRLLDHLPQLSADAVVAEKQASNLLSSNSQANDS